MAPLDEQFANPLFSENIEETHFGGFLRKKTKQQDQQQEVGVAILVYYCLLKSEDNLFVVRMKRNQNQEKR